MNHLFGEIKEGIDKLKRRLNERCGGESESSVHKSKRERKKNRSREKKWRLRLQTTAMTAVIIILMMMSMGSIFQQPTSERRSGGPRRI